MSYKTLVVHLDDGPRCAARVALAGRLAGQFGARLIGIVATGLPDVIVTMNRAVPDSVECIVLSAAQLRAQADAAAHAFERQCAAAGTASFESRVVVSEAVDAVVRHGRCSDLVIVGQTDRNATPDGVAFDFPQQVLLHTGTPTLVVPHAGSFTSLGRRVLVAWKEVRESSRAIRDALPLLRRAEAVALCAVAQGEADSPEDDRFDAVVAWLGSHGIRPATHVEAAGADVGDRLLSRAADFGADLIVCGGYGHSRLREWVLGGTTRHLLEHMTVPTLLSH